jgi:hypothetical protein
MVLANLVRRGHDAPASTRQDHEIRPPYARQAVLICGIPPTRGIANAGTALPRRTDRLGLDISAPHPVDLVPGRPQRSAFFQRPRFHKSTSSNGGLRMDP